MKAHHLRACILSIAFLASSALADDIDGKNDLIEDDEQSDEYSSVEDVYDEHYMVSNETAEVFLNASDFATGHAVNASRHVGFVHGFVESLSVILVSEIGDKTFFIAAIMAMTSNKLTIFLAAISALALMTVLSALLGWVVTSFIPRIYTYYACTVIMFLFGLKMLYEAYKMKPDEAADIQQEVQEELERRGSIASGRLPETDVPGEGEAQEDENNAVPNEEELDQLRTTHAEGKKRVHWHQKVKENSLFGKRCYKVFKLFVNCFTVTFLAEWGDRSQLATIVLASINDVAGVCVGGVLGHSFCTGLAVLCGALVAKKISVRAVTLIGALVFLGFAVASLFFDPEWKEDEQIKVDVDPVVMT